MQQLISPIRDIVHDYITPSTFEAEVIDSPYFQRLHFVWQNSAAYTVYPCNKNSRFAHSLGVSHLSGRIFIHSLRNSSEPVFADFITKADEFVTSFVNQLGDANRPTSLFSSWEKVVGNLSRFRHHQLSADKISALKGTSGKPLNNQPEFLINTLWIALRIAGLTHDIGHLPMSHEFEKFVEELPNVATVLYTEKLDVREFSEKIEKLQTKLLAETFPNIGQFQSHITAGKYAELLGMKSEELEKHIKGLKLHERRSIRILDTIRVEIPTDYPTEHSDYRQLLFRIATAVLLFKRGKLDTSESTVVGFLGALKDILSGNIDADRLDYVARDPRTSGLETGVFDLNRIVSSFVLVSSNGHFRVVPGSRSLTAIEAFFHQRYLNYKSLIFHKSALRSKAVLREALKRIVGISIKYPKHEISKVCARYGILVFEKRSGTISELLPTSWLNLVSFDDARLRSMFFDVRQYCLDPESKDDITDIDRRVLETIVSLLDTFLFRKKQNLLSVDFDYGLFSRFPFPFPKARIAAEFDDFSIDISRRFGGELVPLILSCAPRIYDSDSEDGPLEIATKLGTLAEAGKVSPYLKFQSQMVKEEPRFMIGFCMENVRNLGERAVEIKRETVEFLNRLYSELESNNTRKTSA
jgi:HD superfamily phosphohydrolase